VVAKAYYFYSAAVVLILWSFAAARCFEVILSNFASASTNLPNYFFFFAPLAVPILGIACALSALLHGTRYKLLLAILASVVWFISTRIYATEMQEFGRRGSWLHLQFAVLAASLQLVLVLAHVALIVRTSPLIRPKANADSNHADVGMALMQGAQTQKIGVNSTRMDPEELEC